MIYRTLIGADHGQGNTYIGVCAEPRVHGVWDVPSASAVRRASIEPPHLFLHADRAVRSVMTILLREEQMDLVTFICVPWYDRIILVHSWRTWGSGSQFSISRSVLIFRWISACAILLRWPWCVQIVGAVMLTG